MINNTHHFEFCNKSTAMCGYFCELCTQYPLQLFEFYTTTAGSYTPAPTKQSLHVRHNGRMGSSFHPSLQKTFLTSVTTAKYLYIHTYLLPGIHLSSRKHACIEHTNARARAHTHTDAHLPVQRADNQVLACREAVLDASLHHLLLF